jgi:hypothetical protein
VSTFDALYLRLENHGASVVADVEASLGTAGHRGALALRTTERSPWVQLQGLDERTGPELGRALSASLVTESIFVFVAAATNSVGYWHFRSGVELRALSYGLEAEGVWSLVRGVPEDWEAGVLWPESGTAAAPAITSGDEEPFFSAPDLAQALRLPGFGLEVAWLNQRSVKPRKTSSAKPK